MAQAKGRRWHWRPSSFVITSRCTKTHCENVQLITRRTTRDARLAVISARRFVMEAGQRKEIAGQSLILLHSDELPDTYREAATIEGSGGQVLHIYGSRVMIGQVPAQIQDKVAASKAVRSLRVAAPATAPARLSEA